jgi:HD superfamily phosphodiesterase
MKTEEGKNLAKKRHNKMVEFLSNFISEWEGLD